MENELTITEKRFLRSLLAVKTDIELADMLEKPVEVITQEISNMTGIIKRPASQINELPPRKKKVIEKQKRLEKQKKAVTRQEARSVSREELQRAMIKKRNFNKSILPVRQLDLQGKIAVKLNSKTTVYVTPGTDIEKLKKQLNIK